MEVKENTSKRVYLSFTPTMMAAIQTWREEKYCLSDSEAIRRLIMAGLNYSEALSAAKSVPSNSDSPSDELNNPRNLDTWTDRIAWWVKFPHRRPSAPNQELLSSVERIYVTDVLRHAIGLDEWPLRGVEVRRVQRVLRQLGYMLVRDGEDPRSYSYEKGPNAAIK